MRKPRGLEASPELEVSSVKSNTPIVFWILKFFKLDLREKGEPVAQGIPLRARAKKAADW
jgi:hypothetical protein